MASEPAVGVQRQIILPWSQAFRISIRNITLRLGRAAITAAGIVLVIGLLGAILTAKEGEQAIESAEQERGRVVAVEEPTAADVREQGPDVQARTAEARSARQWWLIGMSLLVCVVGIINSMLMSVTERFREIGTMKCLGALDGFIIRLFLIESFLLGFLGSLVGATLGFGIELLVYGIKEGFGILGFWNWPVMLVWLGSAVVVGGVLALVAAVPPAVVAAKLPPAAALRTEV